MKKKHMNTYNGTATTLEDVKIKIRKDSNITKISIKRQTYESYKRKGYENSKKKEKYRINSDFS